MVATEGAETETVETVTVVTRVAGTVTRATGTEVTKATGTEVTKEAEGVTGTEMTTGATDRNVVSCHGDTICLATKT